MTDDFDAIMRGSTKFTDVNFPIDDGIYWADAGQQHLSLSRINDLSWVRLSDKYTERSDRDNFWGTNGIEPGDIN